MTRRWSAPLCASIVCLFFSLAILTTPAFGFSTFAGSCKHAGVNHGLDKFEKQSGNGGYRITLSTPASELVPGTTVKVKLAGATKYKGLLLFAEINGGHAGSWGELGDGLQTHPSCKYAVTHDVYHLMGRTEDEVPWLVPSSFAPGDALVFKATVVRNYATWFALQEDFEGGGVGGSGEDEAPAIVTTVPGQHAPGEAEVEERHAPGEERHAPSERHAPNTMPDDSAEEGEPVIHAEEKHAPTVLLGAGATDAAPLVDEEEASHGKAQQKTARAAGADAKAEAGAAAEAPAAGEGLGAAAAILARRRRLKLLHGGLMLAGWAFAAPVGTLTARYCKGRGPVWFDVHRLAQSGAVLATLVGCAVALLVLRPRLALAEMGPHGVLGCLVASGAVFQAAAGALRPPKTGGRRRAAWEKLHKGLGWATAAAALANCWLGMQLLFLQEGNAAVLAMLGWLCACLVGTYLCVFRFGHVSRAVGFLLARSTRQRQPSRKLSV